MPKTCFLLVAFLGLLSGQPKQPPPQITMCSTALNIGARRPILEAAISKNCYIAKSLREDGKGESWMLIEPDIKGRPVGTLQFDAERLTEVEKSWAPKGDADNSAGYARALVLAAQSALPEAHSSSALVRTFVTNHPEAVLYVLVIDLPNGKRLRVELLDPLVKDGLRVLDIQEHLGK